MSTDRLKYFARFLLTRRNYWFLILVGGFALYKYYNFSELAGDHARLQILLSVIVIAAVALTLAFATLTVVPWYLHYLIAGRASPRTGSEQKNFNISIESINPVAGEVQVRARVDGIRKPLFGSVRLRLIFDDYSASEPFLLDKVVRQSGKYTGLESSRTIWMPRIDDYKFKQVFLQFEDVFHVYSLPFAQALQKGFFTIPKQLGAEDIEVLTDRSESPLQRVQQHKASKGELIDYKKYAPGDDVRRIIWKNFAKARELTVRIPERNFPYVSTINVLASFYDGSPAAHTLELKEHVLNIYKEKIRQVLDSIVEQEYTYNFYADQIQDLDLSGDQENRTLHQLSACDWQSTQPPESFLRDNEHRLRNGSTFLIISSLCPTSQVNELRRGRHRNLNLGIYRVSGTFELIKSPSLITRTLIVDPFEPLDAARRRLSARRTVKYIRNNDSELQAYSENYRSGVIFV